MSAVKSGFLSISSKIIQLILTGCSLALLGRLLNPEDFGLFAIVLSLQALFAPFLNFGLQQAYVKETEANQKIRDAYHGLNLILGLVNAGFLLILAPFLAFFYNQGILSHMVILFSGTVLINAMSAQRLMHLFREKRFGALLIINNVSLFCGIVAAVITALLGFPQWALLANVWTVALLIYFIVRVVSPQRYNHLTFSHMIRNVKNMRYGLELTFSRLLKSWRLSLDKIIFGKMFGTLSLGFYTKAIEIARMPDAHLRMALTSTAFAYLSRQDLKQRIQNYVLFCNLLLFIAVIPAGICVIMGDLLMPFIMGPKWIIGGRYLQLFGIWGIGKIISSISELIYMTEGRPRKLIFVNGLAFPIILGAAVLSGIIGRGPEGFILGLSFTGLFYWWVVLYQCFHELENGHACFKGIVRTFLSIAVALLASYLFRVMIDYRFSIPRVGALFFTLGFFGVIILPIQHVFNKEQFRGIIGYLKDSFFRSYRATEKGT